MLASNVTVFYLKIAHECQSFARTPLQRASIVVGKVPRHLRHRRGLGRQGAKYVRISALGDCGSLASHRVGILASRVASMLTRTNPEDTDL